ncbi:hypothetical protein HKD37_09G026436 [Glycine soja]
MGEKNIPIGRHWQEFLVGVNLEQLLQYPHQLTHRHGRSVAQIVEPQLGRPTPSAPVGSIQRPQTSLHNIINVSKVPRN